MKFTVREGFVVHHTTVVEVVQNGKPTLQEQSSSYWEGQTVDLEADEARLHAHKLAPADKAATAWMDGLVLSNVQAQSTPGIDASVLATAIAQALAMHSAGATAAPAA